MEIIYLNISFFVKSVSRSETSKTANELFNEKFKLSNFLSFLTKRIYKKREKFFYKTCVKQLVSYFFHLRYRENLKDKLNSLVKSGKIKLSSFASIWEISRQGLIMLCGKSLTPPLSRLFLTLNFNDVVYIVRKDDVLYINDYSF